MAMQASSMAIIEAGVMPCIRIIDRIMVLHMSAQFMHDGEQSIICVEHTVHACSQAEHASMQACRTVMSIIAMSGIEVMFFDIASVIIESIAHRFRRRPRRAEDERARPPACRQASPQTIPRRWRGAMSRAGPLVNPVAEIGRR